MTDRILKDLRKLASSEVQEENSALKSKVRRLMKQRDSWKTTATDYKIRLTKYQTELAEARTELTSLRGRVQTLNDLLVTRQTKTRSFELT